MVESGGAREGWDNRREMELTVVSRGWDVIAGGKQRLQMMESDRKGGWHG